MCVACGLSGVQGDWTNAGLSFDARSHADRRLGYLARLLQHHGLAVRRSGFGSGYIISDSNGLTLRAGSVDELWPAAQALTGRVLDPLDPVFLARADP